MISFSHHDNLMTQNEDLNLIRPAQRVIEEIFVRISLTSHSEHGV